MTIESGSTFVPNAVLRDPRLTSQARLLYSILKSYAWQDGDAFPGQKRLAEEMGCSDRMVRIYLQELEDSGLVNIEQRGKTITNKYYLTDQIKNEWNPTSASDRKPITTHKESDRKQVSSVTGNTLPLVTGNPFPTNKTQENKTQTNKTQPPLTPQDQTRTKRPLVVDEHAKAKETLRALIARPNEQFINGGTSKLINTLVETFPQDWIYGACELAAGRNASLTYVKAVLDHWQNHGFKCECRNPKAPQPIPIQQYQKPVQSKPRLTEWGTPYADVDNLPWYPKDGTFGVDLFFGPAPASPIAAGKA